MNQINEALLIQGMTKADLARMIRETVNEAIGNIKMPDPGEEVYFKAKDNMKAWGVCRATERKIRTKAIALGLLIPVEISPGVLRYRRSQVVNLDLKKLK